ncbi:16701_t:CDS:2, partial [Funneliformis mosseae]
MRSLISRLPESLVTRLPEVIPIPISEKESREILLIDDKGTELLEWTQQKDRLRDLMLEGVNIQWGKKCIGYDEVNDEVWAIFEDETRERGDILIGCDGIHSPISQDGDALTLVLRLIPIETDITANTPDDQIHYPAMIHYSYYTHWDTKNQNVHVNDDDPQSVIDHSPKESEISFFGSYNPPRRRPIQDINPSSIEPWVSSRVTLLGDSIHAMNPVGGLDADLLVKCLSNYEKDGVRQCIQNYENIMRIRASRD